MKTYNHVKQEVLINNIAEILYQGLLIFSEATYIDRESGRDKRFGEPPVIPISKKKDIFLFKERRNENKYSNQDDDDDDDDHCIEHRRHNIVFLDKKKKGWCHM